MQSTRTARIHLPVIKTAGRLGFAWTLTWIVISIDVLWLLLAGWSVSGRGIAVLTLAIMVFRAPLAIGRYRSDLRIRVTARAAVLLIVFMASAATLSYLVTSTNAPLVDAPLAAWDRALGFDWLALHGWLQSHPPAQTTLHIAYQSGLIQLAFVILFLGFSARPAQLDEFMRLFIVATVLTILMSGPFPAAGAWKHHALAGPFDLSSLSHFELLRDGRMRDIPLRDMQGLISIPSLHTVMAVLLVYAMRGTGILLSVFIVVNVAMLVSIPVDGGHYLVDVIAGAAMAFGLIALERRQSTRPHAVANTTLPTTLKEVNR
ncbi:putative membrane protein [Rhodoferax ferrireducens T118]|uniref:Putative membrane protein n=1 Tax=Albidiferax ferrireducens (strain ATCC BAA-621 / DSM 15236 / T118) TaxID=338969 RepID=Q220L9_ALBFT|nr:putative membrane protein [Rhodoferax ferrireducens T118]